MKSLRLGCCVISARTTGAEESTSKKQTQIAAENEKSFLIVLHQSINSPYGFGGEQ
jgi:hypothetical protein